jgi:uncharacterized protein (TIGR02391 family)
MTAIPKIDETHLQAVCNIIGDTNTGLTGSEIDDLLRRCHIDVLSLAPNKRTRLLENLRYKQKRDACANNVVQFIHTVMNPVRFVGSPAVFELWRAQLNEVLAFAGWNIGEDGKLNTVSPANTLTEAQERVGRLRAALTQRNVHHDVLRFCRAELLQDNYFHAVFEATKSVAQKIRDKTGLTGDGADIVDKAFGLRAPMLAINSLRTDTEQSEQTGFANLLKGMFGTFRNPTGHAAKITWKIDEQDALDLLSLVSYMHRRLDAAAIVPRTSATSPTP